MSKKLLSVAIVAAGLGFFSSANAGVYSDDLGKCFVKSSSPTDQIDLMRWIFSAIALHPAIKSMANISGEQRAEIDKKAGALFERLLTTDCHSETVAALKYEGAGSLAGGFNTLGQIAGRGLFSAPEVNAGMAGLQTNLDMAKINTLYKEAGLPAQ